MCFSVCSLDFTMIHFKKLAAHWFTYFSATGSVFFASCRQSLFHCFRLHPQTDTWAITCSVTSVLSYYRCLTKFLITRVKVRSGNQLTVTLMLVRFTRWKLREIPVCVLPLPAFVVSKCVCMFVFFFVCVSSHWLHNFEEKKKNY